MNSYTDYLSLAHTDFRELRSADAAEAEERINLVFCDPQLVEERLRFITAIQEAADPDGLARQPPDFTHEIDTIRQHGVLDALRDGHVSFDSLDRLSRYPDALRQAHEAAISIPDIGVAPPQIPLPEVVELASNTPVEDYVTVFRRRGVTARVMDFKQSLAAGRKEQSMVEPKKVDPFYGQKGDSIVIKATLDEIPHGLCRLGVLEMGTDGAQPTVTLVLPGEMMWQQERWFWKRTIREILNGRDPKYRVVKTFLVPATEANRHEFNGKEVRKMVMQLPDGLQRSLASKYLGLEGSDDE